MKTAVVICNGEFPRKEYPRLIIREADYIICCDAAFQTYLRNQIRIFGKERLPDAVIGDMDSLSPSVRKRYSSLIIHDTDQETNDQTKAVCLILEKYRDVDNIHIAGATGKRADHTIGNASLLMEYERQYHLEEKGIRLDMVSDYGTAFAITDSTSIHCGEGRSISIFTPDNSLKIKSDGLVWPTDDVVFDNWWKATLNRSSKDVVNLELSHKSIALIMLD